jgi:hypothetical protein
MDLVKWAIILSVFFLIAPVICIVIYILTPLLLSLLMGANGADACNYDGASAASGSSSNLQGALSNLCNTAKSFLGITAMLMIVLASPLLFLSNAVVSFEIFQAKTKGDTKVVWLAILWALPVIGGLAYLFKGRKNFKAA